MVRLKYAQQYGIKIGFKGFNLKTDDDEFYGICSWPSEKSTTNARL